MRKKVTKITLGEDEAAIVFKGDEMITYMHDQPVSELISSTNFKVGLVAMALGDEKTTAVMIKNLEKQLGTKTCSKSTKGG